MLALALLVATASPALDPIVLDLDATRGLLLVEVPVLNPLANVDVESHCDNQAFSGLGSALLVLGGEKAETFELVGWPEKGPCPTKQSAAKARATARSVLAARGLDLDGASKPSIALLKADGALSVKERVWSNDETLERHTARTILAGGTVLRRTEDTVSMNGAGELGVTTWLVQGEGATFVLERLRYTSMRDESLVWRVETRMRPPANGVDVAALSAVDLGACHASLVANAALVSTQAATVAQALTRGGKEVPVTTARAARGTSVVYATDTCTAAATALSKAVPGGATVEKLTWESRAPIVVALGETPRS